MSKPVGKGEKRDTSYMRMDADKLELLLATGYAYDTEPIYDYFEQRFDGNRRPEPDIMLSLHPDFDDEEKSGNWSCVATCFDCGRSDLQDVNNYGLGIGITYRTNLVSRLFHGNSIPDEVGQYELRCLDCYKKMIPYAVRFRELVELNYYVNQLKKAIYEKRRSSNNG